MKNKGKCNHFVRLLAERNCVDCVFVVLPISSKVMPVVHIPITLCACVKFSSPMLGSMGRNHPNTCRWTPAVGVSQQSLFLHCVKGETDSWRGQFFRPCRGQYAAYHLHVVRFRYSSQDLFSMQVINRLRTSFDGEKVSVKREGGASTWSLSLLSRLQRG